MNATWARTKQRLIGSPIRSAEHEGQLLSKSLALPVFSSDCLSSVAYATEEIMLVLALAGAASFRLVTPVALAIASLMAIVVISYRQTVRAYPDGGGAFIVAHDNLGLRPAMVAASSLLIDYVLTVAVSVAAGVAAITSAAPPLLPYRVPLALGFVMLLAVANLRGTRESGRLFAGPTYGFILIVGLTLLLGFVRCFTGSCPQAPSAGTEIPATATGVTLFLLLRAFASGASALTGTEAIANGVQAFRYPKPQNAASTLGMMGAIAITMFIGVSVLAVRVGVRISPDTVDKYGTVLSQIGRAALGGGIGFVLLQAGTAAILVLGANTAYQDFPRLSAILAGHRLMPRQFRNRGDRLVFSNGILAVALLASLLIVTFQAEVTRLIQLYVVGVFTSFTLSQSGMVRHWLRSREKGWQRSVLFNAVGALTTGVVLVVVIVAKFTHGAWIILVAIPLFVLGMAAMRRHYLWVAAHLREARPVDCTPNTEHRVVVLASRSGRHLDRALRFARLLQSNRVEVWHVEEPGDLRLLAQWNHHHADSPLVYIPADQDGVAATLRRRLRQIREAHPNTLLTVVVAEQVGPRRWRHAFAHREGALAILWALRQESGVAVADIHYHRTGRPQASHRRDSALVSASRGLLRMAGSIPSADGHTGGALRRVNAVVLVSEVTAPTLRAVQYACAVCPGAVRTIHAEIEPEQRSRVETAWARHGIPIPLEVVPSPYRDLTSSVLDWLDRAARQADPGTMLDVIIPEFVVPSLIGKLLHNQSSLWIRGALYADPRVVVTSLPWVLGEPPEAT